MKLLNEDQLLDKNFRAHVIQDICSSWNVARKNEAKKRYEVNKDNTALFVMEKLKREIKDPNTLALMENRASNISIAKKIINKLAKVYQDKVTRSTNSPTVDLQIDELARLMNFNKNQKKCDRYTRLFKNSLPWIYPDEVADGKYRLCMKILSPWQYDVIEKANDPEDAACVILSDFVDRSVLGLPLGSGPQVTQLESYRSAASTKDATISMANTAIPSNDQQQTFIWWSDKYHFTTDSKGEYIGVGTLTPADYANPIGIIPGVTAAEDQDGEYWAEGGQDLVDGAILVNTLITDMNAIAYMQGWGQLVITGRDIPQEFVMGPHHALILQYDSAKNETEPKVQVINANPPLSDWRATIEEYVALLLSTNNLSPTTIAMKLDIQNMASGIAMLIDRSESTDEIQDKQTDFYWIEMKEWEVIKRWQNLFFDRKLLIKEFMDIGKIPEDTIVTPKFEARSGEVVTEADRLSNLQKKQDLGLITQVDLIMSENPGMTKEEATQKAKEIQQEKMQIATQAATQTLNQIPANQTADAPVPVNGN